MHPLIPIAESLEVRAFLSAASVSQSVLHVVGDAKSANNILVQRTSDLEITVNINGKSQVFGACNTITSVVIDGGSQADRLVVNDDQGALNLPVTMNGRGGDDTLVGGSETDQLIGGDGNDNLNGGAGSDSMWGQAGNDSVSGADGNDVLYGGGGADAMFGGNGNDTFRGGDPHDKMDGGAGKDRIFRKR